MPDPAPPRGRLFLPAIVSGLLLYAAFFPINAGFLAWIALVPLLSLTRSTARPRRLYFAAFVGGLFCYVPVIQWMRVAHPAMYVSWLFLGLYCSLCLMGALAIIRKLTRMGVPFTLAVPVALVGFEYFRSHFHSGFLWMDLFGLWNPVGFGWYLLGHTQHDFSALIQVSDLTGVYGVSFLVAMVNAAIFQAIEHRAWARDLFRLPAREAKPGWSGLVTAALLLATVGYGYVRLNHEPFPEGPQVALIQGNIAQDVKNTKGDQMEKHFQTLAREAASTPAGGKKPDLIVWPETAYVYPWLDIEGDVTTAVLDDEKANREFQKFFHLSRLAINEDSTNDWRRIPTLLGVSALQLESDGKQWKYNSALLVDSKGMGVERYDKRHLVPFGEYVLFGETLPFMRRLAPYEGDYSCKPGTRWTRFPLTVEGTEYRFACIICYEDTDAILARHYVRPGEPGVDFFVNISNDGWFDGTAEHEQHLAICRFRAVETRRAVVRAVNMGISGIVDGDGRVLALPGETWAKSKKVEGVVRGAVPLDRRESLYARFGDWLPLLCWAFILGGFVRGYFARRSVVAA